MMTQKKLSECVGLRFKGFALSRCGSDLALAFEPGVFAIVEAHYSGDYPEIAEAELTPLQVRGGLSAFGNEAGLMEIGVITKKDLDDWYAEEQAEIHKEEAKRAREQEARDRRDYERLRKKFETK